MSSDKVIARIAGILFIVASAAAIIGGLLLFPAVQADYLSEAAAKEHRIVFGVVLEMVQTVAVVGIAVVLFPVLKRQNEGMALGYVGARILEGVFVLVGSLSAVLLLDLSRTHGRSETRDVGAAGDLLLAARDWSYSIGPITFFSISAIVLYVVMYQAELVPRWLSIWGLVGAVLLLISGLLEMFGIDLGPAQTIFSAPIGLNEMVLAIWLIAKGLNSSPPSPRKRSEAPALAKY